MARTDKAKPKPEGTSNKNLAALFSLWIALGYYSSLRELYFLGAANQARERMEKDREFWAPGHDDVIYGPTFCWRGTVFWGVSSVQ